MGIRIGFSLILLGAVLFLPFGVTFLLALVGMIFFRRYFEALALLLLCDLLYGAPEARFFNVTFISFLSGIILFTAVELWKKKSLLRTEI